MVSRAGNSNPSFKHGCAPRGAKRPAIYRKWQHMIQRCHNPNDRDYPQYGGRGITVCDRWRYSFAAFIEDVGTAPSERHTLDRIDNSKGYEPNNVKWATQKEQANNRRSTKLLTINGVTRPLSEWCEEVGIGSKTVLYRLKHMGMSHEDAVFTPLTWTKKERNHVRH